MSKTHCASHTAKAPVPQPLPHLSKAGRPWGLCCSLWVPSNKGMGEREETEIKRTGILHPFLLWPHVLSCSLMNYITFPKEGKRSLSHCLAFSCLWLQDAQDRKTHSPKQEHGEETRQYPSPSPRNDSGPPSLPPSLPQVIWPSSFSTESSQLSLKTSRKPWPIVFLHCMVSVIKC